MSMRDGEQQGRRAVELGRATDLGPLPTLVTVEGEEYFLVRHGDGLRLLSTVCPHKGGRVGDHGDVFVCSQHGWRFDRSTGRCLDASASGLAAIPAVERDGVVVALLHDPPPRQRAARAAAPTGLHVALHAHACVEIAYDGFSLLTDPWIAGPAYFGSWAPYPPPLVDPAALRPSAIWISHEHSDHFHEPTLRLLPADTPVYVPDFPNQRLPGKLAALGFANVTAVPFGERFEIAPEFALTCLEPASLWNDSVLLAEVAGFRYLNLNDAGVNHRIARLVAPVDLVSSTFSPGASGYPLTWDHLSAARKASIMEQAKEGVLEMLREAVELYGAHYLLPFASFFTLWHPDHRRYLGLMRRNTPEDVVEALAEIDVEVIDMIAGEEWHPASGRRSRRPNRGDLFSLGSIVRWAKENFDAEAFAKAYPGSESIGAAELEEHLLRLNETPDIVGCEDVTARVRGVAEDGRHVEAVVEVRDGRARVLDDVRTSTDVTIEMPLGVLARVVREDISWDEAFIGYWCRFDRTPDRYHAGFWRLLQAPYYRRPPGLAGEADGPVGVDSEIADVLERYGDRADRLLRRYGLYCLGCQHAPAETLRHAADKHGLDDARLDRLVAELRFALAGEDARAVVG